MAELYGTIGPPSSPSKHTKQPPLPAAQVLAAAQALPVPSVAPAVASSSMHVSAMQGPTMAQPSDGGSNSSALEMRFPLYVIPIHTLLAMERFEPFDVLNRQGTVVKYHPDSMPTVIFVSQ
jgi:hypothetical protein